MKSSYWKTLAVASAASLLAVGCSKNAESKPLEPAPEATPAAAEEVAPAPVETAEVAPIELPSEGSALIRTAEPAPAAMPSAPARARGGATKAAPMSDTVIKKDTYEVTISVGAVSSGSEGSIKVTLVPKNGRKINLEFPTKLTVEPPAGVTVAKAKQVKADAVTFSEKKAIFDIKFKASAAGEKAFTGKFKFAVCTDATCDPKTEKLAFNVPVK